MTADPTPASRWLITCTAGAIPDGQAYATESAARDVLRLHSGGCPGEHAATAVTDDAVGHVRAWRVELAKLAYNAYGETTEWRNHRGDPMPCWEDLGERVQTCWQVAAGAVAGRVLMPPAQPPVPEEPAVGD